MSLPSPGRFYVISSSLWLAGQQAFLYVIGAHVLENVWIPGRNQYWGFLCVCARAWTCLRVWVLVWGESVWGRKRWYVSACVCVCVCVREREGGGREGVLVYSLYCLQTWNLIASSLSSSGIRHIPSHLAWFLFNEAGCFQILGVTAVTVHFYSFHPWVWVSELWSQINPSIGKNTRLGHTCQGFLLKVSSLSVASWPCDAFIPR
jgi:hypothetical protein